MIEYFSSIFHSARRKSGKPQPPGPMTIHTYNNTNHNDAYLHNFNSCPFARCVEVNGASHSFHCTSTTKTHISDSKLEKRNRCVRFTDRFCAEARLFCMFCTNAVVLQNGANPSRLSSNIAAHQNRENHGNLTIQAEKIGQPRPASLLFFAGPISSKTLFGLISNVLRTRFGRLPDRSRTPLGALSDASQTPDIAQSRGLVACVGCVSDTGYSLNSSSRHYTMCD